MERLLNYYIKVGRLLHRRDTTRDQGCVVRGVEGVKGADPDPVLIPAVPHLLRNFYFRPTSRKTRKG